MSHEMRGEAGGSEMRMEDEDEKMEEGRSEEERGGEERGTRGQEPKEEGARAEALCTLYTRECRPNKAGNTGTL